MAGGQIGLVAAVGLGALQIALPQHTAGADGKQAPGLLPALAQGVVAMVEHHDKAVQHILHGRGYQVQQKHRRHSRAASAQQQGEPPQGKARRESHGKENEEEHQGVSHIAGDHEVISHQQKGVPCREKGGTERF